MWEVGDDESVWDTAVLVDDDEVGQAVRSAGGCELVDGVATSIQPC